MSLIDLIRHSIKNIYNEVIRYNTIKTINEVPSAKKLNTVKDGSPYPLTKPKHSKI